MRGLTAASSISRARTASASRQSAQRQQEQTVQANCPRCNATNQFSAAYSPQPIVVACGSCSEQFPVQMPAPRNPRNDIRLCRTCGNMNMYPLPDIGQPFPGVSCGVCGHISQRGGQVQEQDLRLAELLEASGGGGPMVMVNIGASRRAVPLMFLMALMTQAGQHSNAATDSDIRALPVQKLDGSQTLGYNTECAICMEEFKDGDSLKTLPCLHMYHGDCIDNWLQRDNSCPICKSPIGRAAASRPNM